MLSKEQVEILTDKYITSLYDDLEREVIADIARRVKKTERFTETAELMAQSLREQGYSTARIQAEVHKYINADTEYQKALAENTRAYKQDVKKLIEQTEEAAAKAGDVFVATAGDMSWNDDMQLWKKHDVDLKKPNGLSQLYGSIADQTNQEMKNITRSSGFKGTTLGTTGVLNAYQRTMDLALLKVSTGAFSYQQAVKDCVDQLAKSGLRTIDYASGRSYQLDTAVRMCIRTGANQLSGKIQEMNLAQGDTPLVYVDAHAGSRPEHAVWQGQVYAYNPDGKLRDGSKAGEKYGDFFNETDYGSPTGLMGVNCAHHFYPYWEGDPIPEYHEPDPVEIDGKEYTYYEATQEMRKQERGIRQTKREIEAMKNLGEDTSALKRKLSKQMGDYRSFSKAADINPRNYALGVQSGALGPSVISKQQVRNKSGEAEKQLSEEGRTGDKSSTKRQFYDVYDEYVQGAKTASGKFFIPEKREMKNREEENMRLLYNQFGGDIEAPEEIKNQYKKKNPDYKWNGKLWEEQEPKNHTISAVDNNVREGLHQIIDNPGGVVLDIGNSEMELSQVLDIALKRMGRSANYDCDLIIIRNGKIEAIYRYKK